MAVILFYTSIQTRVRDQESLMKEFVNEGHRVFFLNQEPNPYLPSICENAGVTYQTISIRPTRFSYIRIILLWMHLIRFIYKNKVNVVYSHLEPANFIAVLAQYFVFANIVTVRHHLDLAERIGFNNDLSYKLTYLLSKKIITVSEAAKKFMIARENIDAKKIHHINLGYDFKIFGTYNQEHVDLLNKQHAGSVILVSVGRLDSFKRPELCIDVCKKLIDKGVNTHLFLAGSGDKEQILKEKIAGLGLQNHVELLGYQDNVMDYLRAAHWLLHPSISESSCVVVKEAGLVNLPVMACKSIGDFDEYIIDNVNSILLDKDKFVSDAVEKIFYFKDKSEERMRMGENLNRVVKSIFDIKATVHHYHQFHR